MQNQFDSIDLSDNNVIILEGFPKLPRLKTLILNNNRITRISRHLEGGLLPLLCFCMVQLCCASLMLPCMRALLSLLPDRYLTQGLFPAESIPNVMQLVLTNNRLKNLAVRLKSLCMTSCWRSASARNCAEV